ncbi:MAG: L,D-transpeptidase [Anaerolineales bacterium]|nr:MAG: L,D-transpeptidase [Anaerolineales bacterium]
MIKRLLPVFLLTIAVWLLAVRPAQAASAPQPVKDQGVLCLPGVYSQTPGDCQPLGPSTYLSKLAQAGLTFPATPFSINHPDRSLTYVNVNYGQVNKNNAPIYGSVEDALKGKKDNAIGRIEASFSYISYTDEVLIDGKRFYMIEPGAWMTANDIIRIGSVPLFQGLTFKQTPRTTFGWVLSYLSPGPVATKRTPGFQNQDYTSHTLNNHEVVQVYGVENVGGEDWYMVGPDEWVHQNMLARVIPNTKPPEGVTSDRWIEVNLFEQTIAVYDQNQLVFATLIASGLEPFWTRPGLFQIYEKLETTPMRGAFEADRSDAYYLEDVPWTMYFDQARALHGAYWRANLGFPQSHGCVNLSVGDSRWIFDWAEVGDFVYVWDPSGETPVDSGQYTAGGA